MKLTARKIVDICAALNDLRFNCRLEYKYARKLNDLKKLFKDRADVILEMERKLIETHSGEMDSQGGIKFATPQAAQEFLKEREKMFTEEDEIDVELLDLSKYCDNAEIAVEAVEAIDDIIIFEAKPQENKEEVTNG